MALDVQLFHILNGLTGLSPILDRLIVFCASGLAYLVPLTFLALFISSASAQREKLEIFFVAVASVVVARLGITELIRFFYHRPRPFSVLETNQLLADPAWSFPSGHATFFFALATAIYLYNKKWGIGFFVAAAVITVSRVIAGVHYPSDIAGGAIIGAIVAYLVFTAARRLKKSYFAY